MSWRTARSRIIRLTFASRRRWDAAVAAEYPPSLLLAPWSGPPCPWARYQSRFPSQLKSVNKAIVVICWFSCTLATYLHFDKHLGCLDVWVSMGKLLESHYLLNCCGSNLQRMRIPWGYVCKTKPSPNGEIKLIRTGGIHDSNGN